MNSEQPPGPVEARLDRLRGRALPVSHNARTISALAANPGCPRRALMDAAGVDKQKIAAHIGYPAPFGQSRFAISRGNAFEARVKENGAAELLTLLRDHLDLDVTEVGYTDLQRRGGQPLPRAAPRPHQAGGSPAPDYAPAHAVRPPAAPAARRRQARLPGARPDRAAARRQLPRHRDQVVPGHRRPGRPGQGRRRRDPVGRLRPRPPRPARRSRAATRAGSATRRSSSRPGTSPASRSPPASTSASSSACSTASWSG